MEMEGLVRKSVGRSVDAKKGGSKKRGAAVSGGQPISWVKRPHVVFNLMRVRGEL